MIPGSGDFWETVKGLVDDEDGQDVHYIGDGSPSRTIPKGATVLGKPQKGAKAKALTWNDIRAMNEAYLKDIEQKNIQIKPDETIEELLKKVKTYKDERKALKKGRYSERYRNAVKKIQSEKEAEISDEKPDHLKMTADESQRHLN